MNHKEESLNLAGDMPEQFTANVQQIKNSLEDLEDKLENEEWRKKVLGAVQGAIDEQSPESIERDLVENFNVHLTDEGIINILLTVLANNNPYIFQEIGLEVPPKSEKLLEELAWSFGPKVKRAIKKYFSPDDWRFLNSEARQGDRYQGTRLHTNILKWNGEKNVITSGLPDVLSFADHFIRNLDSKFERFDEADARLMIAKLQEVKDHIDSLEEKLSHSVSEED